MATAATPRYMLSILHARHVSSRAAQFFLRAPLPPMTDVELDALHARQEARANEVLQQLTALVAHADFVTVVVSCVGDAPPTEIAFGTWKDGEFVGEVRCLERDVGLASLYAWAAHALRSVSQPAIIARLAPLLAGLHVVRCAGLCVHVGTLSLISESYHKLP
jgi:hypothetical protein